LQRWQPRGIFIVLELNINPVRNARLEDKRSQDWQNWQENVQTCNQGDQMSL
jgi:hypothetical protein